MNQVKHGKRRGLADWTIEVMWLELGRTGVGLIKVGNV
jgi:hypothetical protein